MICATSEFSPFFFVCVKFKAVPVYHIMFEVGDYCESQLLLRQTDNNVTIHHSYYT